MQASEAVRLIEAIIGSIKANPQQFSINVNIKNVGMQGIGGAGGPGIAASARGGFPGSTAVGAFGSAAGGSQVAEVSQNQQVSAAMDYEILKLTESLRDLVAELRKPVPKRSAIRSAIDLIKKLPIAGWIVGVLEFLSESIPEIQDI